MGRRFAIVVSAWIGSIALGVMVLGTAWLAAAPQAAEAAPNKPCGQGDRGHLWVSGVSCNYAKRVAWRHDKTGDPRFNGWKCDDDKPQNEWYDTTCHRPRKGETQRIYYTTNWRDDYTNWRDTRHPALGAQTALAGDAGCLGCPRGPDDPDLQLWGNQTYPPEGTFDKQKLGNAVKVNVGCGDEACTVHAAGSVYWFEDDGKAAARLASHELPDVEHDRLKPASAEFVGPGETTTLSLKLKEKTRKEARKAFNNRGKQRWSPQADVVVYATDGAGNWANAQALIKLLKHHPRG